MPGEDHPVECISDLRVTLSNTSTQIRHHSNSDHENCHWGYSEVNQSQPEALDRQYTSAKLLVLDQY